MSKENPYHTIGREFEENVIASGEASVGGGRKIEYAFFRMENASETGDALLVSDLLDAAKAMRRADQPDDGVSIYCKTKEGDDIAVMIQEALENLENLAAIRFGRDATVTDNIRSALRMKENDNDGSIVLLLPCKHGSPQHEDDAAIIEQTMATPAEETAPLTLTIAGDGAEIEVTFDARRHDITTIAAFVETGEAVIKRYKVDTSKAPAIASAMAQFKRELESCRTAGLYAKKKEEDLKRGVAG